MKSSFKWAADLLQENALPDGTGVPAASAADNTGDGLGSAVEAEPAAAASASDEPTVSDPHALPGDLAGTSPVNPSTGGAAKQWDSAIQIIEAMNPARNQVGDCVLHVQYGSRKEVLQVGTQACQDYLSHALKGVFGRVMPTHLQQIEQHLRVTGSATGMRVVTGIRVMQLGDDVLIDRNDAHGTALRISSGKWSDGPAAEAPFSRSYGLGEIPTPTRPPSLIAAAQLLRDFSKGIGIPPNHRRLFLAVLISSWWPLGPYPIMNFVGAAGSGKSTAANMVAQLLDPSASGELRNMKLTRDDLAAAAQSYHVLAADNVSRIDAEQSDLLCMVVSGGEVIVRKLYTNGEASVLRLKNPMVVTSIHPIAIRGDLQSRTITFEIMPKDPGSRRSEADLMADFRTQLPALTGAVAELLAAALEKLPEVKAQGHKINHRLTDFVLLGEAMLQAIGKPAGEFMAEMDSAKARAAVEVAAGDGFMVAMRAVLAQLAAKASPAECLPGYRQWHGVGECAVIRLDRRVLVGLRPRRLLELLQMRLAPLGMHGDDWLPRTERAVGQAVTRTMPNWSALGFDVSKTGGDDRPRFEFLLPVPSTVVDGDEHGGRGVGHGD